MTMLITGSVMASSNHDRQGSTSHSLIDRLRNNEAPAWRDLVYLYSPLIQFWARKAGLPEIECPDIMQEVFRSVVTGIHQFQKLDQTDTFRGWLRTITRFKVADYFRKNQDNPDAVGGTDLHNLLQIASDLDDDFDGDQQALIAEHEHLRRALEMIRADFKEKTWQAFWEVVVENRSTDEVAATLQMTTGAVRVAKSRVLKRLRDRLGEYLV